MKKTNQLFTSAMILLINLSHFSLASAQAPAPVASPAAAPAVLPVADNPYGLAAVWGQGDWVAKITILLLIIMSLASWYVLVSKLLEQNKLKKMTLEAEEAFVKASSFEQGLKVLNADSPYRFMVESSLEAVEQHPLVAGQVDLNTWAAQSIEDRKSVV